jgi:predicted Zn-dependent protease with MMP-like domain
MTMTGDERNAFDAHLESVLARLPDDLQRLIRTVPLIVEDHPAEPIMREFGLEAIDELCGLHDGIPLTERSVDHDHTGVPEHIMIYREGIIANAFEQAPTDDGYVDDQELRRQIRITVLHEIGHHFGLDEQQLDELGYG